VLDDERCDVELVIGGHQRVEEFRLKRVRFDVVRASWIVETMLEWNEEKASPIPQS